MAILAVTMSGLFNLAVAAAVLPLGAAHVSASPSSKLMRNAALSDSIAESAVEHVKHRRDAVHGCQKPTHEFGPAPSAEDCSGAIKQLQAVKNDITVKLVEGCYHAWSGNCTASVCPQKVGSSTIPPSAAAQFMTGSVMTECIDNGLRGWYVDRDYGVGVYLT